VWGAVLRKRLLWNVSNTAFDPVNSAFQSPFGMPQVYHNPAPQQGIVGRSRNLSNIAHIEDNLAGLAAQAFGGRRKSASPYNAIPQVLVFSANNLTVS
jgi:hypothetical protein